MVEWSVQRGFTPMHVSAAALRDVGLAIAAGALLGALVAMPYEQILGMSGAACAMLRSAVATAVLQGLCTVRPRDLAFDAHALAVERTE